MRKWMLFLIIMLLLTACGSDDTTSPTPTLTWTPPPSRTPVPTWTPSASPTSQPTRTLVPSLTPRPTLTLTPGITPGAALDSENQLVITAREAEFNQTIGDLYRAQPASPLQAAPVIALEYRGRVQIEMTFYNDFLKKNSQVTTVALLGFEDGRITLSEIADERTVEGALVDEDNIRNAIALAEQGINDTATTMAQAQGGPYQMTDIRPNPGYLEVVFAAQ